MGLKWDSREIVLIVKVSDHARGHGVADKKVKGHFTAWLLQKPARRGSNPDVRSFLLTLYIVFLRKPDMLGHFCVCQPHP